MAGKPDFTCLPHQQGRKFLNSVKSDCAYGGVGLPYEHSWS